MKNHTKTSIFSKIPKPLKKLLNNQNSKSNALWNNRQITQDHAMLKQFIYSQKIAKRIESEKPHEN